MNIVDKNAGFYHEINDLKASIEEYAADCISRIAGVTEPGMFYRMENVLSAKNAALDLLCEVQGQIDAMMEG